MLNGHSKKEQNLFFKTNYRLMQVKSIAILSTFIKLPFVIKIFLLSIFEWPFYTGFTVSGFDFLAEWKKIKVKTDKVNLGKINSSLCECIGRALIELEEIEGIELVKYFLGQIFLLP